MKTITVDLSVESVQKAIDELSGYKSSLDRKLNLVCKRLAEVGAQEAQVRIAGAQAGFYGNDDEMAVSDPYFVVQSLSHVLLYLTPRTVAHQTLLTFTVS